MQCGPDLHSHSTASDGALTPTELVARAVANGVSLLALTDHDTTDGLAEAGEAAATAGVGLLPGVEISVTWSGGTVHVVGLAIDPADPALQAGLAGLVEARDARAQEIGRRLARAGVDGAFERARVLAGGGLVARTHFARVLVERGRAPSVRDCFKRWLVKGKPGYVPGQWASLESAVGWIRGAGGQAVVAHPARCGLTRRRLLRLIGEFRELGGAGLEVIAGSHTREDAFVFAAHCREQGLLASAGSDFHAPQTSPTPYGWMDLGRLPPLPAGLVPIWQAWPQWRRLAEKEPAGPPPAARAARTASV